MKGLRVDGDAIGAGIYGMICERGEAAIVAFGMIPSWAMDLVRAPLEAKVAELKPAADAKERAECVREIEHLICLGIYNAAAKAGRMVV